MARRTVIRQIHALERDVGLEARRIPGKPTVYVLPVSPAVTSDVMSPVTLKAQAGDIDDKPVTSTTSTGDTAGAHEPKGTHKEPSVNPKALVSTDLFNTFWTAYPIHKGKGAAVKAWNKIRPTADLTQTMVYAITAQAALG